MSGTPQQVAATLPETGNRKGRTIDPRKRSLSGRYAFITGASKGIGRATALSKERRQISTPSNSGNTRCDRRRQRIALPASIISSFPRLDILINNAGYVKKRFKITNSDPTDWQKTWSVKGHRTLPSHAGIPTAILRGGDKIVVNLSSVAAHLTSPGGSAFQTSRLAVLRFTEFLDVDHGPGGVLAFTVHPGGVMTDMGKKLPEQTQETLTETPELCADTLVFLTEKRREWLAARYILATWDVEELLRREEEIVKEDKLKVRMRV
ncbi:hypothetical protein BBP40_006582 [Aspergillus hancockii]|nr:hypothetical protein BBP40_006582 [Aspergillus hancockii]